MPYDFHTSKPTRYPHADSIYPSDAETLTWRPDPYDDGAVERAIEVRARVIAYLEEHNGEARLCDVLLHLGLAHGNGGEARETVRALVESGALLQVARKTRTRVTKGRVKIEPQMCAWLVLP